MAVVDHLEARPARGRRGGVVHVGREGVAVDARQPHRGARAHDGRAQRGAFGADGARAQEGARPAVGLGVAEADGCGTELLLVLGKDRDEAPVADEPRHLPREDGDQPAVVGGCFRERPHDLGQRVETSTALLGSHLDSLGRKSAPAQGRGLTFRRREARRGGSTA
jgi:hypothetical protein